MIDSTDPAWAQIGQEAIDIFAEARRDRDAVTVADQLLATSVAAETEARIQTRIGRLLWQLGEVADMRARVDAALTLSGVSHESQAELAALRALTLSHADNRAATISAAERALKQARRIDARRAEADALRALGNTARDEGFNEEAVSYFRQMRALDPSAAPTDEIISLQLLDRYDESARLPNLAPRSSRRDDATPPWRHWTWPGASLTSTEPSSRHVAFSNCFNAPACVVAGRPR